MVNFKRLADHAKRARTMVDQQGGTEALKGKADEMRRIAQGKGTMSDKAKAAAQVAREKPNPAAPVAADADPATPVGGGAAPPPKAKPTAPPRTGSGPTGDPNARPPKSQ